MMISRRSNIVITISLISVLLLISVHQVVCKEKNNSTIISRSTEVAWKNFKNNKNHPYAVVFDYKNKAVSRTQCKNAVEMITSMLYPVYVDELAAESYLTNKAIELIEITQTLPSPPNGTVQRLLQEQHPIINEEVGNNNLRQRRLQVNSKCSAAICMGSYTMIVVRGCVRYCNRRRNLVGKTESAITTTKPDDHQQRALQETTVVQALELANCATVGCDYDKLVTDYEIQGWKSNLVKRRGKKVAETFYDLADKYAPPECTTILAEMTHFVVPLF